MAAMDSLLSYGDRQRAARGFLSIDAMLALEPRGVTMLNPLATFVSERVVFCGSCDLGASAMLHASGDGALRIEDGVRLRGHVELEASAGGSLHIGPNAEVGAEGGFFIRANHAQAVIRIGAGARLSGGGSLYGRSTLGHGAQILGPIQCYDCVLDEGGDHTDPDPDRRAAVLKGMGWARGLRLARGEVILARGDFASAPVRRQTEFHPTAKPAR